MIHETRVSTLPQEAVVFAFNLAAFIIIKDEHLRKWNFSGTLKWMFYLLTLGVYICVIFYPQTIPASIQYHLILDPSIGLP